MSGLRSLLDAAEIAVVPGFQGISDEGRVTTLGRGGSDLTAEGRAGLMELADLGNRMLRRAMHCQGVNLGMNLGKCAGAGVPGHCHMHLVPRWNGDTNFMQACAGSRVIPQAMEESFFGRVRPPRASEGRLPRVTLEWEFRVPLLQIVAVSHSRS